MLWRCRRHQQQRFRAGLRVATDRLDPGLGIPPPLQASSLPLLVPGGKLADRLAVLGVSPPTYDVCALTRVSTIACGIRFASIRVLMVV